MVSAQQIKAGVGTYIETKIMPRLDSKRQFVLGMAYSLGAARMDQMIDALRGNQIVQALGIIDEAGQVDIDALYNAAHAQMQAQGKLALDIPLLGSFAFDGGDLRELRDCIAQQEV